MYTLHVKKIDMNKKYNISLICRSVIRIKNFINLKNIREEDKNKKIYLFLKSFLKNSALYIYIYIYNQS